MTAATPTSPTAPARYPELADRDWLHRTHVIERLGVRRISNLLGCSQKTVRKALARHNIERPMPATRAALTPVDIERIVRLYIETRVSTVDLAATYNVSTFTVQRHLRRAGVTLRNPHTWQQQPTPRHQRPARIAPLGDAAWLRHQLTEREASASQVARELGCSANSVTRWATRHGIDWEARRVFRSTHH